MGAGMNKINSISPRPNEIIKNSKYKIMKNSHQAVLIDSDN